MVSETQETAQFGVIIGMDVIRMGDFSITNSGNQTWASFRVPSIQGVDYVQEANRIRFEGIGRNQPCPCGKKDANGKSLKFKRCHGLSVRDALRPIQAPFSEVNFFARALQRSGPPNLPICKRWTETPSFIACDCSIYPVGVCTFLGVSWYGSIGNGVLERSNHQVWGDPRDKQNRKNQNRSLLKTRSPCKQAAPVCYSSQALQLPDLSRALTQ